jgi:glutamine synthetase
MRWEQSALVAADEFCDALCRAEAAVGCAAALCRRVARGRGAAAQAVDALLAAALDGVERELPLPEPQVGDADTAPNTDRHTPLDLASALDALVADTRLS